MTYPILVAFSDDTHGYYDDEGRDRGDWRKRTNDGKALEDGDDKIEGISWSDKLEENALREEIVGVVFCGVDFVGVVLCCVAVSAEQNGPGALCSLFMTDAHFYYYEEQIIRIVGQEGKSLKIGQSIGYTTRILFIFVSLTQRSDNSADVFLDTLTVNQSNKG